LYEKPAVEDSFSSCHPDKAAGDDFGWFYDVCSSYSNTVCNIYTTNSSNLPNSGDPVTAAA
jgi:hypothetical protein